jgi:hypothetical protein
MSSGGRKRPWKRILILDGRYDTVIPKESTEKLGLLLERLGAAVEMVSLDAGHDITTDDVDLASEWLSKDPERWLKGPLAKLQNRQATNQRICRPSAVEKSNNQENTRNHWRKQSWQTYFRIPIKA